VLSTPSYDATCFARRSANVIHNFVAPLSFCLGAKGKATSRVAKR